MFNPHSRYLAGETSVSIVINVVISAIFMFAVFGRTPLLVLWGPHGLALDFLPQTFMISAMSILVPTLITRRRIGRGAIARRPPPPPRILRPLALRIVLLAALLTITLGGIAVVILSAWWTGPIRFWQAFPMKLLYGALVALIATPIGVSIALSEGKKEVT
jgi:hypothetical protein